MTAMQYVDRGVPKSIPPGHFLMHYHILHMIDQGHGVNGFRAWTDTRTPEGFEACACGWAGLPHYSLRPHVECVNPPAAG